MDLLSDIARLFTAVAGLVDKGGKMPEPIRRGAEKVREVRERVGSQRAKRLTRIAADTAERVRDEFAEDTNNPNPLQ